MPTHPGYTGFCTSVSGEIVLLGVAVVILSSICRGDVAAWRAPKLCRGLSKTMSVVLVLLCVPGCKFMVVWLFRNRQRAQGPWGEWVAGDGKGSSHFKINKSQP